MLRLSAIWKLTDMQTTSHLETALRHMQRILAAASQPDAPITNREALAQITEELELVGYGLPDAEAEAFLERSPRLH